MALAEVVDQNTNYEHSESQAPGPVHDNENWEDDYDEMYKMDFLMFNYDPTPYFKISRK